MKISFDQVSSDYLYPLSRHEIRIIKNYIPMKIFNKIKSIRFGCNNKTTKEGRLTKRGDFYHIRVNFCLKNYQSIILSDNINYLKEIKRFGGGLNFDTRLIDWDLKSAKQYAYFILLHEIGHIIYCEKYLNGHLYSKSSKKEETWCNNYSIKKAEILIASTVAS